MGLPARPASIAADQDEQALNPPNWLIKLAPCVLLLGLLAHLVTVAIWTPGLTALFDLEVGPAVGRS